MTQKVFIGIDDTDVPGGPGTGKVARGLADYLEGLGLGHSLGVTRHQLLVDPRIPYTSHNSSKCLTFESNGPSSTLLEPCKSYLKEHFQEGSDPGLCLCPEGQASGRLVAFGKMAQQVVIEKRDALNLARSEGLVLEELGGTGGGAIGALAAAGLRASGEDGRFVQLRGIKEVTGLITVGRLLEVTDIQSVKDEAGIVLGTAEVIRSLDWVRPSLRGGEPVLRVRQASGPDGGRIWEPVERKIRQTAHEGGQ